jgi:hypothetical protein
MKRQKRTRRVSQQNHKPQRNDDNKKETNAPFGGIELEQNKKRAFSGANLMRLRIT